jgi:hypothetical protein
MEPPLDIPLSLAATGNIAAGIGGAWSEMQFAQERFAF